MACLASYARLRLSRVGGARLSARRSGRAATFAEGERSWRAWRATLAFGCASWGDWLSARRSGRAHFGLSAFAARGRNVRRGRTFMAAWRAAPAFGGSSWGLLSARRSGRAATFAGRTFMACLASYARLRWIEWGLLLSARRYSPRANVHGGLASYAREWIELGALLSALAAQPGATFAEGERSWRAWRATLSPSVGAKGRGFCCPLAARAGRNVRRANVHGALGELRSPSVGARGRGSVVRSPLGLLQRSPRANVHGDGELRSPSVARVGWGLGCPLAAQGGPQRSPRANVHGVLGELRSPSVGASGRDRLSARRSLAQRSPRANVHGVLGELRSPSVGASGRGSVVRSPLGPAQRSPRANVHGVLGELRSPFGWREWAGLGCPLAARAGATFAEGERSWRAWRATLAFGWREWAGALLSARRSGRRNVRRGRTFMACLASYARLRLARVGGALSARLGPGATFAEGERSCAWRATLAFGWREGAGRYDFRRGAGRGWGWCGAGKRSGGGGRGARGGGARGAGGARGRGGGPPREERSDELGRGRRAERGGGGATFSVVARLAGEGCPGGAWG